MDPFLPPAGKFSTVALDEALAHVGEAPNLNALMNRASAIVLFGSRAVSLASPESDWDILCVGDGKTRVTRGLDLVWISPKLLEQRAWLGSELAHHVGAFGQWLKGDDCWRDATFASPEARDRKTHRVALWLQSLRGNDNLQPHIRQRRDRLARRDLQRLSLLLDGAVVPPTPVLDRNYATWCGEDWKKCYELRTVVPVQLRGDLERFLDRIQST